ncbi:MAG TPA: HAD family phosphatase, partial [Bdellovibrionales bacterium]|nr:HAD family phosphatase [Bdellovibrionales bacterium]
MEIKNVVFDLGNVMISWDPRNLYRKLFADAEKMEYFLANVCTGAWNDELDAGRPFNEATAQLSARHPEFAGEIRAYRERWGEMLGPPIQSTVKIMDRIKHGGRHRVFALSNWSAETFPIAEKTCGFFKDFDAMVISGRIGIRKPDPRIFMHLCREHDVKPEETVFIDDVIANVLAARGLGF